jgi:hypothetical protein
MSKSFEFLITTFLSALFLLCVFGDNMADIG